MGAPQESAWTQGLTIGMRHKQMKLKLNREVSERKQVGDAESMVNEGASTTGVSGLFGKGGQV
ncbi:MAG: hypothetical protein M1818_006350 [Claussenomyces sp. TS43310]|nr:MAG: hypothetical protein M1818_006350 [Claussenomyces sp. TS43310]